jgi:hypothetical protein
MGKKAGFNTALMNGNNSASLKKPFFADLEVRERSNTIHLCMASFHNFSWWFSFKKNLTQRRKGAKKAIECFSLRLCAFA